MSVLGRFPRRLRRLLLAVNLGASAAVLAAFWSGTFPNLIASWVQVSAALAIAAPTAGWLGRRLDARQEHIVRRTAAHLAEHHETTRAHVTTQLNLHAATQADRLDVITDQLAALHAKLDQQQGGGTP